MRIKESEMNDMGPSTKTENKYIISQKQSK